MIDLNSELCDELDLTYWQLKPERHEQVFTLTREETELLRKILLAKNIHLNKDLLEIKQNSVAIVETSKVQLIFDDVTIQDTTHKVHLAKLSVMLEDAEQKKLTWHKLKNLNL